MVHIKIFSALILVQTLHIYNFIWRINKRMSPTLYAVANIKLCQQKFYLSNLLIKILLSVNLITFYFMLWIRDGDLSVRLVFYLNYFVEKYIIYISILGMIKLFKITCWRFASLYLFYPSRWWNRQIFMVLHELRWVMKFRN